MLCDKIERIRIEQSHIGNCKNSPIPKDILESIVLDSVMEAMINPATINAIIDNLMFRQEQQAKSNTVLNLLIKEKRQTDTNIDNLMSAILKGVVTETTTSKLKELEAKKKELERQILLEQSRTAVKISENTLREYLETGMRLEPKILIDYFIKEIILYEDKIQIIYKNPLTNCPDDNDRQGFSFYAKNIRYDYKVPQRSNCFTYKFEITMTI